MKSKSKRDVPEIVLRQDNASYASAAGVSLENYSNRVRSNIVLSRV